MFQEQESVHPGCPSAGRVSQFSVPSCSPWAVWWCCCSSFLCQGRVFCSQLTCYRGFSILFFFLNLELAFGFADFLFPVSNFTDFCSKFTVTFVPPALDLTCFLSSLRWKLCLLVLGCTRLLCIQYVSPFLFTLVPHFGEVSILFI